MCKGKVEEKKSEGKTSPRPTRRTPSSSPKTGRKTQRDSSKSGKRNVKVNRGVVLSRESEDSADEEQEYTSETPLIDFSSEDDSDTDYDDDAIEVLCFRLVVSREATSVQDSESENTMESEIES